MHYLPIFIAALLITIIGLFAVLVLIMPDVGLSVRCAITSEWECKDYYHRGFSNTDCSWDNITYCEYGCEDARCLTEQPETCTSGWKCNSVNARAYHNEDCSWSDTEYCANGCEYNECVQGTSGPMGSEESGDVNGNTGGGGGEAEPGFWETVNIEDFINSGLSVLLIADSNNSCEKDFAIAETPSGCSGNFTYYVSENCDAYEYIYGFQDEDCAKNKFDIEDIDDSILVSFEGNVYLMEIGGQRVIKVSRIYPISTEFGYIWQKNRFVFTLNSNNDAYLMEQLEWMVSRYSDEQNMTLELIEVLN